ncbi:hypothetical protein K8942_01970 [Candidatus Peribacteria bacterium]|nr:MAG: hypothetical protein K8942_01970 [Candidatus Peribacteria bacterium]
MVLRIYREEEDALPLEPTPTPPVPSQASIINLARQRSATLLLTQKNNPLPDLLRRLDAFKVDMDTNDIHTMDPDTLGKFLSGFQVGLREVTLEILHCPLAENRVYERAKATMNAALNKLSLLPKTDTPDGRLRQFHVTRTKTLLQEDLSYIVINHPNQHALHTARSAIIKVQAKTSSGSPDTSTGSDAEDWI